MAATLSKSMYWPHLVSNPTFLQSKATNGRWNQVGLVPTCWILYNLEAWTHLPSCQPTALAADSAWRETTFTGIIGNRFGKPDYGEYLEYMLLARKELG